MFVADSAGLALVVARDPGEQRRRLPARVTLNNDLLPDGAYTVTLGIGRNGPVILDLAGNERAILVGGETGSGKTGTVKSIIAQAARKCSPDTLVLALVDLKRLDFPIFDGLSHLVAPVATEEADAENLVSWCVGEMERRQAIMQAAQVTRWDTLRVPDSDRFPLLLIVMDEVADFADSPVMADLVRLARKGRASGISLMLATQRPDAQMLNRQVKANVPTRIAFKTTDGIESKIILDRTGAQELRRRGLCLCNVGGRWQKVQTAFLEEGSEGEWVDTAPAGPVLSDVERDLVKFAIENLDGAFKIGPLYEAFKGRISKRKLADLARTWERRGWLTEPAHATDPRRVTDELADFAGPTLDVQNDDRVIGMTGGDRDAKTVTGAVIGSELPPFLATRREVTR